MTALECQLEEQLLQKLRDLKYEHRPDIRDRAALEANFRKHFQALNREDNDFNLNISRYVSTATPEPEIDLDATHAELVDIERTMKEAVAKHNKFLKELGVPELPY